MAKVTKAQEPQIPEPIQAIEIDKAVYNLQMFFNKNLDWLTHDYGRAYKFVDKTEKRLYLPQVYKGGGNYALVTPDNDKKGTCFFVVGDEQNDDFESNQYNTLNYKVGIVFWVNLKKINEGLMETEKFTQLLIRDVRDLLTRRAGGFEFGIEIKNVQREVKDVYKEFTLNKGEDYHRTPYDGFRFNLVLKIDENCGALTYDPARAIVQNLSKAEKAYILKSFDFSGSMFDELMDKQKTDLKSRL